ncbi:MAG: class I adenylate-forming enzyme family protein [Bacilli bacterium]|nr:class I adenylate-forming enzyme family protein [Bacilli bacterium]
MEDRLRTGYVSIDKPQYKFYRESPIREFDVNQTLYQLVFNSNLDNMGYNSLGYFGNHLTYQNLKNEVDKTALAYQQMGVKRGDIVAVAMINTPEVAVNLLALNKIGAISKWLDVRASAKDLEHYLTEHDCKIMVSLDMVAPKVGEIINNTDIKKVLTVSPSDSLSMIQRLGYKLKNKIDGNTVDIPNESKFIPFQEFIKQANGNLDIQPEKFDKEKPSVIVQSSGTTGIAKSIVHNDYSFTSFVDKLSYSDLPFAPKKSLLVVVPPFVAYGLADSLFLALAFGMKAELSPKFDPNVVFNNMGKFNLCFAAPFHYRYLADNISKIKKKDLEEMECLISGGDKITIEELKQLKEILGLGIINGYGNNEGLGAVTYNPNNANKFGTVGIPKFGDEVIIYDTEAKKELKYGEIGEVCYKTDTMFMEYSNNEDETNRIKQKHVDGAYWVHTGDLGSMDAEGYLTLEGRSQRVIVRLGFKISPMAIESVIEKHPAVKECMAIAVPDEEEEHVPMLFYTLKDEYLTELEKVEEEIKVLCSTSLKENMIPKHYSFIESMPYTDNNKYDFRKLEELGKKYVEDKKGHPLILNKVK